MIPGAIVSRPKRARLSWALLVAGGLSAAPSLVQAATIIRSVSNTTQLRQLFTDANANTSNSYQGNLAAGTYAITDPLNLPKGSVILQGGTSLSQAGSYIITCPNSGCSGTGQVFRAVRETGYAGTLYLKLTGVTVRKGSSNELGERGGGGALMENGTLEVTNSIISENKANQWGAGLLAKSGGSLYLTNSIVRDNENSQNICGGGDTSFAGGVGVINGLASIINSSITGNKACKGAGLSTWGKNGSSVSLSLSNSTVSGNRASHHGGGIVLRGATKYAHISFSTIAHNVAGLLQDGQPLWGGGIGFQDFTIAAGATAPPIRIWGTILAKNSLSATPNATGQDCYTTSTLDASKIGVASNFVGKNGNCGNFLNWTSTTGGSTLIGTEASPLDPLINATLTGPPGAPLAHVPLSNSPVLSEYTGGNRSRNLAAAACPGSDIAKQNRGSGPTPPTHCDIGAYEASTCFTTSFIPLTLASGWTASGWGGPPQTAVDCEGQQIFKGAIETAGFDPIAAFLSLRAPTWVYVPIDLWDATKGRLAIDPSTGATHVQTETQWSNAQGFTSLDGPSFALDTTGFTALSLTNGWSNAPFSTRNAAYSSKGGIVRLQGAIATSGSNLTAFTLPPGARPPVTVYVNVDLYGAAKGRLFITSDGTVTVDPYDNTTAAKAFTSLEGAWFALSATGYTTLTLGSGWTHAPWGTRNAAFSVERGMVRFQGGVATFNGNTNRTIFTLPAGARPSSSVWLPVSLCDAAGGRLNIFTDGSVNVEAEISDDDASCFTSLEGARFGL
jgi:hypothetical protein